MVYPAMIFGYAMMVGGRPTSNFWLFIIFYTILLIFTQFLLILFYSSTNVQASFAKVNYQYNLGLLPNPNNQSEMLLQIFWPEIILVLFILLHMQVEARNGVLDLESEVTETFDEAIQRFVTVAMSLSE